jgi:hypothetical protein
MGRIFTLLAFHIAFVCPAFMGCATSNHSLGVVKDQFPVVLYVTSQSSNVEPVNISVKIDEKVITNQAYYCGSGHNFTTFDLNLTEGEHRIVVGSSNGDASLDRTIVIDRKKWLVVSYSGKDNFRLEISNERVVFI